MMPKTIFISITFCFLCSSFRLIAQKENAPVRSQKKKIDEYIKAEMKAEQIPGLTYAVVLDGKIIDSGAYGFANAELKAPTTSHTLFNIGSIGKTFTATAIMLLQKEGKLSINDPISKFVDSVPDTWKTITIKHLLSHTSGIKDYAHDFPGYPYIEKDRKQEITEAQFIRMATAVPLNFQPGERWAYSNSNFVLLGFIIHKVSAKPIGEFMKERLFKPAGLTQTRYTDVREIIPNRANGYLLDEDDGNKLINGEFVGNFFSKMGDMGILTTATDLARWSIAQDEERVLDKKTLQQMWTASKLNSGLEAMGILGANYGLGWSVLDHRGNIEIGHDGSFINGYTACLARFPEKHFAVIVLTNLNPTNVSWISYNIAGFYFPQLKGFDQLKPETNADNGNEKNVDALLEGLANDNLDTSLVTMGFKQRINPVTKLLFSGIGQKPVLKFVHADLVSNNLVRYGVQVKKINYYQIKFGPETHYLAIYYDVHNKVADIRGY